MIASPVGVTDEVAAGHLVGTPGCGEAAGCHAPIIAIRGDLEKGGFRPLTASNDLVGGSKRASAE